MRRIGRRWARGGGGSDDMGDQLRMLGLPADIEARDERIEILPDMIDAVRVVGACATQWRFHPTSGVPLGLDYGAVREAASWMGIDLSGRVFDDLRGIEAGIREELMRRWH